jgi:hypothetical protein
MQINTKYLKNVLEGLDKSFRSEAERLIQEELAVMIAHDNFKYP